MARPPFTVRPLLQWADPATSPRRSPYLFRADWDSTLRLLTREIGELDGRNVTLQIDVLESDIKLDGSLKAGTRVGHPGVVISFDSRHGPLRYATDAYESQGPRDGWRANVRAIALSLQALRSVDRWGVTRRGQQYTGWKALPAGDGAAFGSADDAAEWLIDRSNALGAVLTGDPDKILAGALRFMQRKYHPDISEDRPTWEKVGSARTILAAAKMI